MSWYYDANGRNAGPHSDDEMADLIRSGAIGRRTLVWADGMPGWSLAGNQRGFSGLFRSGSDPDVEDEVGEGAPPPEAPFGVAPRADQTIAGPWSRYFARSIDVAILDSAASYGIFYVLWQTQPAVAFQILHQNQYLPGFLCLPVAMLLNALIIAFFGNSIGKAVFGIRTFPLGGERLTLGASLRREAAVYFGGLGIGFPLISLFTAIAQFNNLRKSGAAGYDRGKWVVRDLSSSRFRRAFGILVAFALFFGLILVNADASVQQRYPTPSAWTNPTTGIATTIPAGWTYSQMNQDGATIYAFENQQTGLVAFFAAEQSNATVSTLDAYDAALKDNLAAAVSLGDWSVAPSDPSITTASGVLKDGSSPETVYTLMEGMTFWRVVFIDQIDKTPRVLLDGPLMAALVKSILSN